MLGGLRLPIGADTGAYDLLQLWLASISFQGEGRHVGASTTEDLYLGLGTFAGNTISDRTVALGL